MAPTFSTSYANGVVELGSTMPENCTSDMGFTSVPTGTFNIET